MPGAKRSFEMNETKALDELIPQVSLVFVLLGFFVKENKNTLETHVCTLTLRNFLFWPKGS